MIINDQIRLIEKNDTKELYALTKRNKEALANTFAGFLTYINKNGNADELVNALISRIENKTDFPFVILNDKNEIIGYISLKQINWEEQSAEMGYFIDKAYYGKGIVPKGIHNIISYSKENLGLLKFILRIEGNNKSSIRVAEKCGFKYITTKEKDYQTLSGSFLDLCYYEYQ